MIEDLIDDILNQRNLEEIKQQLEKEKDSNRAEIVRNEGRKKEITKEYYEKAIMQDSLYNENLKEEALRISKVKNEETFEVFMIKEMPQCKNIDSVIYI